MDDTLSPPLAALSDTDHGALIIVATYIMLILSMLGVILKIYTRVSTAAKPIATDYLMIVAISVSFVQAIVITTAAQRGLGRRSSKLDDGDLDHLTKALYASNILSLVVLATAKCSVISLIVSIQPRKFALVGCYCAIGIIGAWCIAGIVSLALQCQIPEPWVLGGHERDNCVDQYALRAGLSAVDILTDFMIVGLSYAMMHGVQVQWHRKWTVVLLFALRILYASAIPPGNCALSTNEVLNSTPAFVICQLVTWQTYYDSDPDERPWNAVAPSIWNQIVLAVSIITSCIPSIKKFLTEVQSGLMGATISEQYEMTHSGGKSTQLRSNDGTNSRSRFSRSRNRSGLGRSPLHTIDNEPGFSRTTDGQYSSHARIRGNTKDTDRKDETESVESLTRGAIHQRVDVDVDFEESSEGRPSR